MNSRARAWSEHRVHILQPEPGMSTPVPTPRAAFHPDAAPKNASTKRCCLVREEARGCLLGLLGCLWGAWQGQAGLSPRVPVLGGGRQEFRPQGQEGGCGEFALAAGCHGCIFQRSKQRGEKKEEEENQNILLGGKKNSGVKKCRRVMRRPSEAKKCMRSSLETGV